MSATVKLGDHEVPVYGQRHAYLTNKLAKFFQGLTAIDTPINGADDLIMLLGDQGYDLLTIVIPAYGKRCPKYEFAGYGSAQQYEDGDYDENEDKSPTFQEIRSAFEAAADVNCFDVLRTLAKVVDPKLLRSLVNTKISEAILSASVSSPAPTAGSSTLTDSGMTLPTSTESAG